eukprot:g1077.t1
MSDCPKKFDACPLGGRVLECPDVPLEKPFSALCAGKLDTKWCKEADESCNKHWTLNSAKSGNGLVCKTCMASRGSGNKYCALLKSKDDKGLYPSCTPTEENLKDLIAQYKGHEDYKAWINGASEVSCGEKDKKIVIKADAIKKIAAKEHKKSE